MPFQRILVPIDGSAPSLRGLEHAIELARLLHARLFLLHVLEPSPMPVMPEAIAYTPELVDDLQRAGADVLARAAERVTAAGATCETRLVDATGPGVPAAIVAESARIQADLIVLGTHGRSGLRRMLLGSAAETVVREGTAPVLLVRAG